MRSTAPNAWRAAGAAALALLGGCGNSDPVAPAGEPRQLTVVVAVVDSLMPSDLELGTTPELNALKTGGTFYPESRAVYAAETIPNHVAMMTGVYPDRSGIPTNDFIDFASGSTEGVKLQIPEKLTATTLFTWIDQRCRATGVHAGFGTAATMSKSYLYEIFRGDAQDAVRANDNPDVFNAAPDTHWDPATAASYIPPPDGHTPDPQTMDQALLQLPAADFFFLNLGDVDRSAHAGGLAARNAALPETDTQVGRLVDQLVSSGRWENTVLFIVSDHGMDYSDAGPVTLISTQDMLDTVGACHGVPMSAVPSGGTESIYVTDRALPLAQRQAALRQVRACLLDDPACSVGCMGAAAPMNAALIAGAWYTADDPADAAGSMPLVIESRHANLGDLTVFADATGKFGDPPGSDGYLGGFIPGNHGHPLTLHNTLIVAGGSPWVKKGQVIAPSVASPTVYDRLPEQSENVDLAPTIAWLLGLSIEPGQFPDYPTFANGFDGRVLKEAFVQFDGNANAPSPTACGQFRVAP
jgi:ectonucleotide pyrophosphatase/phosphodiesterase family protein 5